MSLKIGIPLQKMGKLGKLGGSKWRMHFLAASVTDLVNLGSAARRLGQQGALSARIPGAGARGALAGRIPEPSDAVLGRGARFYNSKYSSPNPSQSILPHDYDRTVPPPCRP